MSSDAPFKIYVDSLVDGRNIKLTMKGNINKLQFLKVKKFLAQQTGIPVEEQELSYRGVVLAHDMVGSDVNIQHEDTLQLNRSSQIIRIPTPGPLINTTGSTPSVMPGGSPSPPPVQATSYHVGAPSTSPPQSSPALTPPDYDLKFEYESKIMALSSVITEMRETNTAKEEKITDLTSKNAVLEYQVEQHKIRAWQEEKSELEARIYGLQHQVKLLMEQQANGTAAAVVGTSAVEKHDVSMISAVEGIQTLQIGANDSAVTRTINVGGSGVVVPFTVDGGQRSITDSSQNITVVTATPTQSILQSKLSQVQLENAMLMADNASFQKQLTDYQSDCARYTAMIVDLQMAVGVSGGGNADEDHVKRKLHLAADEIDALSAERDSLRMRLEHLEPTMLGTVSANRA